VRDPSKQRLAGQASFSARDDLKVLRVCSHKRASPTVWWGIIRRGSKSAVMMGSKGWNSCVKRFLRAQSEGLNKSDGLFFARHSLVRVSGIS